MREALLSRKAILAFVLLAGVVVLPLALDVPQTPVNASTAATCSNVTAGQTDGSQAIGCLLIPDCFRNSDCDAVCGGPRTGRCVHNDCPIRVCSCR